MNKSYVDEPKKTRASNLLLTFTLSVDGIVKLVRKRKDKIEEVGRQRQPK